MRLTCPNCGAQYEVDEAVIPDSGRDVQCSNCGNAWFQQSAAQLAAAAEAESDIFGGDGAAWTEAEIAVEEVSKAAERLPASEPLAEPVAEPAGKGQADTAEPAPAAASEAPEEPESAPFSGRQRRTLDDAVRTVLLEEAEREARARAAEGSTLETQFDLGLSGSATNAAASAIADETAPAVTAAEEDSVVSLRGDEHEDGNGLVSRASRLDLLPDIEEINSTLRATSERGDEAAARDAPETLRRRRSGFRLGFLLALLVTIALLGTYVLAPAISERFPGLRPSLQVYVAGIDSARLHLDNLMKSTTEAMRNEP